MLKTRIRGVLVTAAVLLTALVPAAGAQDSPAVSDLDPGDCSNGTFVADPADRPGLTPDLEDHELPGGTLLRFWATDTPGNVQTLRLSDARTTSSYWDLIWARGQFPVDVDRNTTWHIDLTIPASTG